MLSASDEARVAMLLAHRPQLRRFVGRRVGPDDADDLVAEVYVAAWRRLGDVPHEPRRAAGWLYATASNLVRNHVRGSVRRRRLVERVAHHAMTDVRHGQAVGAPGVDRLVAGEAWNGLSGADRQVLALVASGASYGEAGEVLGVDGGAIRMRVTRARRRLRGGLDA